MKTSAKTSSRPKAPGESFELKPRNQKELAALYGISAKTMRKWLDPLNEKFGRRIGNYYTIPQVKQIFDLLGTPSMYYEGDEEADR